MRRKALYFLSALVWYCFTASAVKQVHLGVLDQNTGSFEKYWMTRALEMYLDWFTTKQNSKIGGVDVELVVHRVDGQSSLTLLPSIVVDFMNGNWTRTYYTPENGFDNEPEQHPLDVLALSWSSALIPTTLQALKDAGIHKPVYAAAASGTGVWFEGATLQGPERWDFAVSGQGVSEHELTETLKWLANNGAKTIVLLEEAGSGSWAPSVCLGIRTAAKELDLDIILDKTFVWPCKNPEVICEDENFQAMENVMGSVVKRGKRKFTADVFLSIIYGHYSCPHELKWFQKNNINFRAYVMMTCADDYVLRELNGDRHKFIIGASGWSPLPTSENFDERYSSVQVYADAGDASPRAYFNDYYERYGNLPHYAEAWHFATFYYLHRDLLEVGLDTSKLITQFKSYRSPEPSFFGLLGSGRGGINTFHKFLGIQVPPDDITSPRIIAPAHLATDVGIYPVPTWYQRDCWPECVDCQLCEDIVAVTPLVLASITAPFLMMCVIMLYWHVVLDFKPINIWIDVPRCALVLMNVASDVMAVMVLWMMMEEELLDVTDEYKTLLYLYCGFTVFSVYGSIVRIKWLIVMIYGNIKSVSNSKRSQKSSDQKLTPETISACRRELAVTCFSCVICDIPMFLLQATMLAYVTELKLATSIPLITSMIMSAITIGSVGNSTVEFNLYKQLAHVLGSKDDMTMSHILKLVFNPFLMHKTVPEKDAKVIADERSREGVLGPANMD